MKKTLSIIGAVLFTLGFAMATGVDQNPVQAIYAVVLMGGACVSFNVVERMERTARKEDGEKQTISDAARLGKAA